MKLTVESQEDAIALFGVRDENLKFIERSCGVRITHRSGEITVSGAVARSVGLMIEQLLEQLRKGGRVELSDVKYAIMVMEEEKDNNKKKRPRVSLVDDLGRPIKPMSPAQRDYMHALMTSNLVFSVGPAGTGKTYLAVAMAVRKLLDDKVKRLIICRPAVEAGEKLGFLPGDFQQKVDPYLRPIYDALFSMMGIDKCTRYLDRGIIEVAPLAFMRGRTLEDAFVLLDEAQNTTIPQMKMFLTRFGRNSSVAVTGDITQTDLPPGCDSGLVDALDRLRGISEIRFVFTSKKDVVRHELVAKIIEAYESSEK